MSACIFMSFQGKPKNRFCAELLDSTLIIWYATPWKVVTSMECAAVNKELQMKQKINTNIKTNPLFSCEF